MKGRGERDLARDLAHVRAPQAAAGVHYEDDPGAYLRRLNNAHNGYVGGTRGPTITSEEAAELAELTNEERRNAIMGWGSPPVGTTSRRQQETDDMFDRSMKRALRREEMEAAGG